MNVPDIVLASASPRRRQLLAAIGIDPIVRPVDVDEQADRAEAPVEYVRRLAAAKADATVSFVPDESVVIAADTAVVLNGVIFGKPESEADFRRMIGRLSGRSHEVYTAVAVRHRGETRVRVAVSRVTLREVTATEARRYWMTGEPRDKAGGYGIQGLGSVFVSEVHGSYTGVVGLPLFETADLLSGIGIDPLVLAMATCTEKGG